MISLSLLLFLSLLLSHTDICKGIPTFILLNTTGLSRPARADQLELLSITGGVIKTLPIRYYPERKPYGIWNITDFMPPREAFFLRVTGYDRDGFLFQRVSSVSFSNIIPGQSNISLLDLLKSCREKERKNIQKCLLLMWHEANKIVDKSASRRPKSEHALHHSGLLLAER